MKKLARFASVVAVLVLAFRVGERDGEGFALTSSI